MKVASEPVLHESFSPLTNVRCAGVSQGGKPVYVTRVNHCDCIRIFKPGPLSLQDLKNP